SQNGMLVVYFKTLQQNPGQAIEPKLYDVVNLLSGYFFMLALHLTSWRAARKSLLFLEITN
ncbi:hypothetical protein ACLIMR_18025, partial [Enterococcus faecium]